MPPSRRQFLRFLGLTPIALAAAACAQQASQVAGLATATSQPAAGGGAGGLAPGVSPPSGASPAATALATLAATPACPPGATQTMAQTEGPYFKPNSPERTSLTEQASKGTRLRVSGRVLTRNCQPVGRALIDVWQADDAGQYDNSGFKYRGHQYTAPDGTYTLDTIVPGLYPGRTRHIHVKVQAPGGPVLTTQLYFPNEPGNARDGIFDPKLVIQMQSAGGQQTGNFDFVVA